MEHITTDHEEIKKWATLHHGNPQSINHPVSRADTIGIRINFPGPEDDVFLSDDHPPKDITWDEFFNIFEEQGLAFIYDSDRTGDPSLAYRFSKR